MTTGTEIKTGIEPSELEMIMEAIKDFATQNFPESKLLELDHKDEPVSENHDHNVLRRLAERICPPVAPGG